MTLSPPIVEEYSEEFGLVEHKIRMTLASAYVNVVKLEDISLKPICNGFKQYVKGLSVKNVVDVFINVDSVSKKMPDILKYGMKVDPVKGFKFCPGKIVLDQNSSSTVLIHIQVALGNVLSNLDPNSEVSTFQFSKDDATSLMIPEGYQSMCISDKGEFIIFSSVQVNALHIVTIEFSNPNSFESDGFRRCGVCGQSNASIWCRTESMKLCEKCDRSRHIKAQDHDRVPILKEFKQFWKCPYHPEEEVNHFCTVCKVPVCLKCKVTGSHSKGSYTKHKLVSISKAYEEAYNSCKNSTELLASRERKIMEQIKKVEESLNDISRKEKSIENDIMAIAKRAIDESRMLNIQQSTPLKTSKNEVSRKFSSLLKQKNLYDLYAENAHPLPFLETSHRFDLYLQEAVLDPVDYYETKSEPIIVYGRIEISSPLDHESSRNKQLKKEYDSYSQAPVTTMATLEPQDPRIIKLSKIASKRIKKLNAAGKNLSFTPFSGSDIIADSETAEILYHCFPLKSLPQTNMLYSSIRDGRSISKMHRMIDGLGVTCVLVRTNRFVFGGFASSKWNCSGEPTGNDSSFLFSISKDAFIPYNPQSEEPISLIATKDTLSFGGKDLLLDNNLDECSSELENSYGVGFIYGSEKARSYLAGQNKFSADVVEVWGFVNV